MNKTKSYCVATPKPKKSRHRRVGSGSFAAAPKYSPSRDRRYQSEPENRKNVKLVDTETQTDVLDISEMDISPNACCAMRDISMTLAIESGLPSYEVLYATDRIKQRQSAQPQTAMQCIQQLLQHQNNQQQQTDATAAALTPTSLNGNSMTPVEVTFQDACSSPDQLLDDVINSNERLDLPGYCSSNEHLDRLGEKVIKFINENRLSIQTTTSISNQGEMVTSRLQAPDNGNENANDGNSTSRHDLSRDAVLERMTPRTSSVRRKHHQTLDKSLVANEQACNNANVESNEDIFDDSWSDEEGEDTDYHYGLRRRR